MFMLNPIAAGVMAAAAQEPPAPIGCTITLTGDIGPIAGYAPADVSGQSFGITDAAPNIYIASTDFVNRRPMPAPGKKVWIQCDGFSSTDGVAAWAGFYLFDAAGDPIGIVRAAAQRWNYGEGVVDYGVVGLTIIDVNNPSSAPIGIYFIGSEPGLPQYLSIAVDSEGEVFFYDQQAGEVVAASSIEPGWAGFFENAESMCLVGAVESFGGGPTSGTGHFTTAADDMQDVDYLGGDVDWCGNEIPAPPAPIVTATFDPSHKSASVALSSDNRRASSAINAHCGVMAVPSKTSGKWFVEYIVHSSNRPIVGFAYSQNNTEDRINPPLGEGIGLFWWDSPWRVYHYGSGNHYSVISRSGNLSPGDRVTVGYDIESKLFHAYVNGEPVEGGPWPLAFTPSTSEVWPVARLFSGDDIEIAEYPVYPIPGFQPWGDGGTEWAALVPVGSAIEPVIDGRSWSVDDGGSGVMFQGTPPPYTGRRAFEFQPLVSNQPAKGILRFQVDRVITFGSYQYLQVNYTTGMVEGGTWSGGGGGDGYSTVFSVPYVPGQCGAIVIDGESGTVEWWWNGELRGSITSGLPIAWIVSSFSLPVGFSDPGTQAGATLPLEPSDYAGWDYDGADALNGEPLGGSDPLPEFTFTLAEFENGSIVDNPGAPEGWSGAWWHNDYVPPSVITVDEPAPVMSTSELAAWVEAATDDADAQDEIPDGTEIGVSSHWWKWERKPAFFKPVGGSPVYYETLAEALADVSPGDMLVFCARTWNNTGGEPNDPPGPRILTSIAMTSGEFEVAYTSPFALFTVGEPE